MKTITFLILMFMLTATDIFSQTTMPPLETGVSQSLAKWRAAHYSDVRYKLNITLEKGAPLMRGTIEVSVKLTDEGAKNDLVLDWRTTQFANDKDKPFAELVKVNEKIVKETAPNGVFDYQINKEHLVISKKYLKTGENVLQIKFASPIKTSGSAITRYVDKEDGAEYIYSLFVPSDASTAFPVFDQPDLKARFSLTVDAPSGWKVISNSIASSLIVEGKFGSQFGRTFKGAGHFFEETKPISTYVFAFAAGNFEEILEKDFVTASEELVKEGKKTKIGENEFYLDDDVRKRTGTHIFVRKSQAEKFKQHSAEVFRLNREGVKFLESYFDYKFPFPKYDLVLIPEFPFNGMEHAGATFIRESSIIFPTEPTKNDYVSRANVMFHEAAHQWFGDTVTMKWFDDLWLKEGFAEFMAYKTLEKVMPEYNAWKIFYERNKQAAYLTDSTRGTTPIYQEIPNLSSAKSAYGNIVYRKAPSFLKQAEFLLGEKEFQIAVRAFLKKHEFANAAWEDLVEELRTHTNYEKNTKRDLRLWASNWIKQRGLSKIELSFFRTFSDRKPFCIAEQENVLNEKSWWESRFRALIILKDGKRGILGCFTMKTELGFYNSKSSQVAGLMEKYEYEAVIPNYQDYGYGIFLLDKKSRNYILKNIQNEKDDFLRSMMWGSLWDSVREGELDPQEYVTLVIKNLNVETDESTIQTLLGRTSTAMNYYIKSADNMSVPPASAGGETPKNTASDTNKSVRNADSKPSAHADGTDKNDDLSRRLEDLLIEKMQNAPTVGQKITFYRAFLNTASSEKARKILKSFLLDDKVDISRTQGFQIKTKDKFDIVTRLLILGDKHAPQLLAELEKSETSDEAKRYAYAAKAGIGTAENKAKYWKDFVNNKETSESWIEAAFISFNSPKHSDLTLPYLEKALAELPNLKRNRKIFFVNGWLSAFIGGQKSEEALKIVNKFLADNPNLDKDLRLKILENSDTLERAVKIRGKFKQ